MRPDFIYVNTLNAGAHIKYQLYSIKLNIKDLQTHKTMSPFFFMMENVQTQVKVKHFIFHL